MASPVTCRVVFSGPFCCGKTTIIEMLAQEHQIPKIIDDSTRQMRPNERQGFPYNFISREAFLQREAEGCYHEAVVFNNNHYGVPKGPLYQQERWSLDVLSKSWKHYKDIPGVIGIYLEPPSEEELIRRARHRGDSEERIRERIEALKDEDPSEFTYRIPAKSTVAEVYAIVLKILFGKTLHTESGAAQAAKGYSHNSTTQEGV